MNEIAQLYNNGLPGWAGPELAKAHLEMVGGLVYSDIKSVAAPPTKKMMLFEVVRKVLGKDTENYAQQIGDCTSFGAKNALEYLQCTEILLGNQSYKWRPI